MTEFYMRFAVFAADGSLTKGLSDDIRKNIFLLCKVCKDITLVTAKGVMFALKYFSMQG